MSLAETGQKRIEWVQKFMPVLENIKKDFSETKPFEGITVGMALHLEPKTCNLVKTLEAGGATVAITGCNPLSTQDDAAEGLAASGTHVYAKRGQSTEEYYRDINKVLDHKPDLVIDDGCDLIFTIHKDRSELLETIKGGCEETTTGIHRLLSMQRDNALKFPVMNINDADCKHLFDNVYGTGESSLTAIMTTTNTMISGKNFVVAGYGYCGQGLATKARGLGANVIVTEIDPVRALKARMDGYRVMPMLEAVKIADYIITVTGIKDVVSEEHFKVMKDKCILCNSGHFNVEINQEYLEANTQAEDVNQDIRKYKTTDGREFFLLAGGRLVNLAASKGLGHPIEVMDLSFALQALGLKYVLENDLAPGVHDVPRQVDKDVSAMKLKAMDIAFDQWTPEQKEYSSEWDIGT